VFVHERVESFEILLTDRRGRYHSALTGFQIFKYFGFGKRKLDFVAIQHLKHHDFMAEKAELLESQINIRRGFQQICEKQNDTPTVDETRGVL
jgi:hypothetical protein